MRFAIIAAALLSTTVAASAAELPLDATAKTAVAVRRGQSVVDANRTRLGVIDTIAADGSIGFIVETKYVRLPANAFTVVDGKVVSQKTKRELR